MPDPTDITTPAVDAGQPALPTTPTPDPAAAAAGNGRIPPQFGDGRLGKLEGEVGLIYRELGDINATVQATRLLMLFGLGAILLATVILLRAAPRGAGGDKT